MCFFKFAQKYAKEASSGRDWRGRVGVRKIEKRHRLEMTCAVFYCEKYKKLPNEEKAHE